MTLTPEQVGLSKEEISSLSEKLWEQIEDNDDPFIQECYNRKLVCFDADKDEWCFDVDKVKETVNFE